LSSAAKSTSTSITQPALAITSKSCFLLPQQNRKLKLFTTWELLILTAWQETSCNKRCYISQEASNNL